jgi:hypothetical protein
MANKTLAPIDNQVAVLASRVVLTPLLSQSDYQCYRCILTLASG